MFIEKISPFKDSLKNYDLIITGGIGAGKSTICQIIKTLFEEENFSVKPIMEYINYDPSGETMLCKFLNKEISNSTFQHYILDVYDNQYSKVESEQIIITERPLEDSIACFANISYQQRNGITINELLTLWDKANNIIEKYQIAGYNDDKTLKSYIKSNSIVSNLVNIIETIHDDLVNGVTKRIIVLLVDNVKTTQSRISKRGRDSEKSYSDEYLTTINNYYINIVDFISNGYKVDITMFGALMLDRSSKFNISKNILIA
jgi:deoxyadenosine/deoxycytidine kinase